MKNNNSLLARCIEAATYRLLAMLPVNRKGELLDAFHQWSYDTQRWENRWAGYRMLRHPFDVMNYQTFISEHQPSAIIELGTCYGGGSLFFCHMLENLVPNNPYGVITVDIKHALDGLSRQMPQHPRLQYVIGSSVDTDTMNSVLHKTRNAGKRLIILDSDHSTEHVAEELRIWAHAADLLVVEDCDLSKRLKSCPNGPDEAVKQWLREPASSAFREVDMSQFGFTAHRWFVRK